MNFFKLITDNNIEIEWNPAIVFCRIKAQNVVDSINPHVGVKYKETGGDKVKALELCIQRVLEGKS